MIERGGYLVAAQPLVYAFGTLAMVDENYRTLSRRQILQQGGQCVELVACEAFHLGHLHSCSRLAFSSEIKSCHLTRWQIVRYRVYLCCGCHHKIVDPAEAFDNTLHLSFEA